MKKSAILLAGLLVLNTACTREITHTVVRLAWTQLNEDGFGSPDNISVNSIVNYRSRFYAGTTNRTDGGEVWRFRGITPEWDRVSEGGFGDAANTEVRLWTLGAVLYAGTRNEAAGAEFWEFDNTAETWTQINADGFGDAANTAIRCLSINPRDDIFLVGTENAGGAQIWRYDGGTAWTRVLEKNGFGNPDNSAIACLYYNYFDDHYYAGTTNEATGGEIWRSADRTSWVRWNTDGFGDAGNRTIEAIAYFADHLLATTTHPDGGGLWAYDEGTAWDLIGDAGLGDTNNTTLVLGPVFEFGLQYLTIGTENTVTGGEIWVSYDGLEWGQHNDDGFEDPGNYRAATHFLIDATMQPLTAVHNNVLASSSHETEGAKIWNGLPTYMEYQP